MPTITLTLPVADTEITAGLHASNYAALQTLLNGGLDANNWASGKIFAPSKLTQEAATSGQALVWDSGDSRWEPTTIDIGTIPVYRKATEKDVVNTTTETDLLNDEVTIAGGVMSTTKAVRLTLMGDYLNFSGAQRNLTLKFVFGSTTMYADTVAFPNINARRPVFFEVVVANLNAANAQWMSGIIGIGSQSAATTGTPDLGIISDPSGGVIVSGASVSAPFFGVAGAEDTASSKALKVLVTHDAANANCSIRCKYATVELL